MKKLFLIFFVLSPYLGTCQIITTIAGTGPAGYNGDGIPATMAKLNHPGSMILDSAGSLFVGDGYNNRIREVNTIGIINTYAGTGVTGYSGDGGLADTAKIGYQLETRLDIHGNLIFSDCNNNRIRKVDAATGIITTIAGTGTGGFSGDSGPATAAELLQPGALAIDKIGNIYVGDISNYRVRKIDTAGIITTYAGNGVAGYSGDGGLADTAELSTSVLGVACDTAGNLYIADRLNYRIREVNAITHIITTIAGNGTGTYAGTGIPATAEGINPEGLTVDTFGNLFMADFVNYRVLKMDATGTIYSIAGTGVGGYNGDGGLADTSELFQPFDVTLDPCDNLYIADGSNNRIRKITYPPIPITLTNTLTATTDTLCAGASVTYTETATASSGTISYQWYMDGTLITAATSSSYTYAPANGDSIRCVATAANPCTSAVTSSNSIYMVVNPTVTPTINITASTGDTVCSGTTVTYSAVAGAGSIQWYVNGSAAGTGATYSYTPANGDNIMCVLTSSAACATAAMVNSNTITMTVNPTITPTLSITASTGDVSCSGVPVTFNSVTTNAGSAPIYEWYVNSAAMSTSSSYTYTPTSGDEVMCIFESSALCASPATVVSNTIEMIVDAIVTPTITVTAPAAAAVGSTVTVNATIAGAGGSYSIRWYDNSVLFNTTTVLSVTYTKGAGTDDITATVVPEGEGCYDSTTSSVLIITVSDEATSPVLSKGEVTVYPNPVADMLYVDNVGGNAIYRILSIVGSVLQQGALKVGCNSVNVSGLPAGVYMVEVSDADGVKVIKKVVKE